MARVFRRHGAPLVILLIAFVASRCGAYAAGVRFDASPPLSFYQFADPVLLQNDLVRTIWWMHMQPPMLNVLTGIGLHLPPTLQVPAFALVFLSCGVVLMLGVYALCHMFHLARWVGVVVAILVGCSPSALVYENILFYPYLVAAGLVVTFVGLLRYFRTGSTAWGLISFGAAALLVLTRATYHPLWLVGLVAVAVLARPQLRRKTLLVAAIPLLLGGGLYVKNWVQFGSFTGSSWMGLNLAHDVRLETIQPRDVSGILAVPSFAPLSAHKDLESHAPTGIPILDQRTNSFGGVNYNNLSYIDLSNRYLRASASLIKDDPALYLRGVNHSLAYEFAPTTSLPTAQSNSDHLHTYARTFDVGVGAEPDEYRYFYPGSHIPGPPTLGEISWTNVFVYALALGVLPVVAWRARYRPSGDNAARWVLAAASATIWIGLLSSVLLETTENSRFRFETDPIAWVLAAVAISAIARRVASWRRRRTTTARHDLVIDLTDTRVEPDIDELVQRPAGMRS